MTIDQAPLTCDGCAKPGADQSDGRGVYCCDCWPKVLAEDPVARALHSIQRFEDVIATDPGEAPVQQALTQLRTALAEPKPAKQRAPLVFADTEDTDIGPRKKPWEMAMVRVDPDGRRTVLQAYIKVNLRDANPFALDVGRFYQRHPLGKWIAAGASDDLYPPVPASIVHDGKVVWDRDMGLLTSWTGKYLTRYEAAALWVRWTHGCHVIGAVPNFDTEVMAKAARRVGLVESHHYHLGDIENIITGWLLARAQFDPMGASDRPSPERDRLLELATPPWDSNALFDAVGVTTPPEERHTALGDALSLERAWNAMYGKQWS